jgi:hypothetical protein
MHPQYKISVIALASIALIGVVLVILELQTGNKGAMAGSGAAPTVRQAEPAVQQRPIVPADALAPLDTNWRPLTGDNSN